VSTYILFLLLGLGNGAVFGILALGLVLKYRSAGVVDFGHAAVAMFIAYVYLSLRADGTFELPWPILPHSFHLSHSAIGTAPSMVISLVYAALLGWVLYALVYRPLRYATPLARVCASVGTMLYFQSVGVLNFSTQARSTPDILPSSSLNIAGVTFPVDRAWFAGIVLVLAAILAAVYHFTRFGLATRAAAENEKGAAVMGLSADSIASRNWIIATVLAGLAGILIAPIATVDPASYTLFIVPALGVALLARFNSFFIAALAGLLLGMGQSLTVKLIGVWTWLPQQGLPDALPFIVIMVVLVIITPRVGARGESVKQHLPALGLPRAPYATAAGCFAAGTLGLVLVSGSVFGDDALSNALISSFVFTCLALSLVVLTGYIGQVSLAQIALAGISGFVLTHVTSTWGLGFPIAPLIASLAAIPVGVAVGLPALRLRGVNLAVVTLAAATAIDALVFNLAGFTGGLEGRNVANPTLFGWDIGITKGDAGPRIIFGVLVLLVVCLVGVMVARLRRSATGRSMIAIRSNERAAAAAGINVARTKLLAFALSAWIAGIGGVFYAYQVQNVSGPTFSVFASLSLVAITFVAGIGRISGAVFAGIMMSANGLFVTFLDEKFNVGKYAVLVAGILLTLTAIKQPEGVTATPPPPLVKLGRGIETKWRRRRSGAVPTPPGGPDSAPI
jgi:ABC-type branched-subunit amino acid transport system permease subunit